MAAVAAGQVQVGFPSQLQLLLLQCLSSALNQTKNSSTDTTTAENFGPRLLVSIDMDKEMFNVGIKERLLEMEQKLADKIHDFQSVIVEEVKSSCKSEEHLPDLIRNISNIYSKNEEMLRASLSENRELLRINEELQTKLNTFTQTCLGLQKALTEEVNKLSKRNNDFQVILSNITITNQNLERKVEELQEKLSAETQRSHTLELNVKGKEVLVQQTEGKLKEATQRMESINSNLESVTNKYSKIKEGLGLSEFPLDYCKITANSVLWKLAHKDSQTQTTSDANIWIPNHTEVAKGKIQVQYSSSQDKYFRSVSENTLDGWDKGVFKSDQIFRMVENDFKVAYLARKVGTSEGSISWKFDLGPIGRSVDTVKILFSTSLFHDGKVDARLCSANECLSIPGDKFLETSDFQGVSQLEITAKTTLGITTFAWQHAQLFRQLLSDATGYGFDITITLKKCDILVL